MVVRKINNKGNLKRIGKFPSIKVGSQVWFESPLERDYIHLLEADSAVIFYEAQSIRINYTLDGRKHFYTPDFFVKRSNGIKIIEVKPESKVSKESNQFIFQIAYRVCCDKGWEFLVVTDTLIRRQPKLDNLKSLWKYARIPINSHKYQLYCQEFFQARSEIALGMLFDLFALKGVSKEVVYGLLYWGIIEIDLMQPLNKESVIRLPKA